MNNGIIESRSGRLEKLFEDVRDYEKKDIAKQLIDLNVKEEEKELMLAKLELAKNDTTDKFAVRQANEHSIKWGETYGPIVAIVLGIIFVCGALTCMWVLPSFFEGYWNYQMETLK